jgi:hypothetical protein
MFIDGTINEFVALGRIIIIRGKTGYYTGCEV